MFAGLKTSMFSLLESFISNNSKSNNNSNNNKKDDSSLVVKNDKKTTTSIITNSNTDIVLSKSLKDVYISIVLSIITAIAVKCGEEDVSIVLGIVGSVLGTVIYIYSICIVYI